MFSDPKNLKPPPSGNSELLSLAEYSSNLWDTFMSSVADSQADIAEELQSAMRLQSVSVYELHERTGLSCELIDSILDASYDLSDSLPISIIEQELKIHLNDL